MPPNVARALQSRFLGVLAAKKKAEGKPQFEGSEQTHEDGQGSVKRTNCVCGDFKGDTSIG